MTTRAQKTWAVCTVAILAGAHVVGCGAASQEGPAAQRSEPEDVATTSARGATVDSEMSLLEGAPERIDLALDTPNGFSGLTVDDEGLYWAIPEKDRVLVTIASDGTTNSIPLLGFPDEVDAEAIAYLGEGRFAIGTESTDPDRDHDLVYFAERTSDGIRVTGSVPLPYAPLSVSPAPNKGIEGLCASAGFLVAALEPTALRGEVRVTSLAVGRVDGGGSWVGHDVALSSDTGKMSALHCRESRGGITVIAVERHFEVMRILRFVLPDVPSADAPIEPEILRDLGGELVGDPNLEGLAATEHELVLINDNHYGERTGPNELFRLGRRLGAAP